MNAMVKTTRNTLNIAMLSQYMKVALRYGLKMNAVEPRLSELMWGEGCLDNQKVHKIEHPYIYIQSYELL